MKRLLILFGFVFLALGINKTTAQEVLGLPYVKEHTEKRKPMPYEYLREADIMWSKTIWRRIELKEKINHPLYFPTEKMEHDRRLSLIHIILEGIHSNGLTAYDRNGYNEFGTVITEKEVLERLGQRQVIQNVEDLEGNVTEKKIDEPAKPSDVKSYLVKELWYFDKQRSVLEVRIIGICPIREYYRDDDVDQQNPLQKIVCWIYYPEARKLFSTYEVFNVKNDAQRLSFDDIFQKRIFSSYIQQESNTYNNRLISEYAIGLETLLEAERIKENIFNFEQDLWEY